MNEGVSLRDRCVNGYKSFSGDGVGEDLSINQSQTCTQLLSQKRVPYTSEYVSQM